MTMIEVYADYRTPTVVYAREGETWSIVPSVSDGWRRRRPWYPSPLVAERMATEANRVTFSGVAWLAREAYGMPADRVAVVRPA